MTWFFIYDDWAEQSGIPLAAGGVGADRYRLHLVRRGRAGRPQPGTSRRPEHARNLGETPAGHLSEWRRLWRTQLRGYLNTAAAEAALVRTGRVNPSARRANCARSPPRPGRSSPWPSTPTASRSRRRSFGIPSCCRPERPAPSLSPSPTTSSAARRTSCEASGTTSSFPCKRSTAATCSRTRARAADFHRAAAEFSALRARFHSAEGLHDPDLDRRHDVAVYLQILEDWVYEGIKWQLLDTDRYGTTIRLTHQENPNQLLAQPNPSPHRTASTSSLDPPEQLDAPYGPREYVDVRTSGQDALVSGHLPGQQMRS